MNYDDIYRAALGFLFLFVARCTFGMVRDVNSAMKDALKQGEVETVQTIELKSIDYMSQKEGHFSLGWGRVNEIDYYGCYEVLEDGGIKLRKLKSDITTIYQTLKENETAYAEITTSGWGAELAIKLYVPENTIQVNYDFSLS